MKNLFTLIILISLLIPAAAFAQQTDPNNGLKHVMTAEEAANSYKIALNFVETDPPEGAIRNVEEFGNNEGVIIRYPFGIPMNLIMEMAKDAKVVTIVANASQQTTVTNQYIANGVNLANCSFLLAPTNSYWTRDYGPWYVTYGNNQVGIVDFPYNRPRPDDDEIPKKVATMQGISCFGMNVIHTGGNYMTNGLGQASSTTLVLEENPGQTQSEINEKVLNYLGINNYLIVEDPNGTYIDHIDCWGKFLAPDKILIRQVPANHPQYNEIEATANFFSSQISSYGTPYKVFRVNTPNNEPYTNSFILKNKVFVPFMGGFNDAQAKTAYQQAMPGYQIFGIIGNQSTPWESTDALHCRTHEIADTGMLQITHLPLHGLLPASDCFEIGADVVPFSGQLVYPDSVWTIFRVNSGQWDTVNMTHTSGYQWQACIPGQLEGSMIEYFIHAEDASNRSSNHPYIGAPDPHSFTVNHTLQVTDTVKFTTIEEILSGKAFEVHNQLNQTASITEFKDSDNDVFDWYITPSVTQLPLELPANETLEFTAHLPWPLPVSPVGLLDTINIKTEYGNYPVMLYLDAAILTTSKSGDLLSKVEVFPNPASDRVTFKVNSPSGSRLLIELYTIQGIKSATIFEGDVQSGNNLLSRNLKESHVAPGIYFYKVILNGIVTTGKLLVVE